MEFINLGRPMIIEDVRILRPDEYELLKAGIPKLKYKTTFEAALFTGMRYVELKRFQKHPEWVDEQERRIYLPKKAQKKHKQTVKERIIRLTPLGLQTVLYFLESDVKLPKHYSGWRENLRRWAVNVNLNPEGLGPKTTRKTWESWLFHTYPERQLEILQNQGHNLLTAFNHYANVAFTDIHRVGIKKYVDGWL